MVNVFDVEVGIDLLDHLTEGETLFVQGEVSNGREGWCQIGQ